MIQHAHPHTCYLPSIWLSDSPDGLNHAMTADLFGQFHNNMLIMLMQLHVLRKPTEHLMLVPFCALHS